MYDLKRVFDKAQIEELAEESGLSLPENPDYIAGLYEKDRLIATGSLQGGVILCLATKKEYQGEGLMAVVVGDLIHRAELTGRQHLFLYTKPQNRPLLEALGFKFLGSAEPYAILMEHGFPDINRYKAKLSEEKMRAQKPGAIVMNLNPLTNGHLYLIEKALARCDGLYIFVVEEDRSQFSFAVRMELLKKTLGENPGIRILPSGPYIISSATFPSYFLKEAEHARAQAMLDVDVFARHVAPALEIRVRFAGSEPLCPVTSLYNEQMRAQLPAAGIEFFEMERCVKDGEAISASRVRKLLEEGRLEEIRGLVPEATWRHLLKLRAQDKT